ncbi:MAG TPA: hypothetical protein PKG77_25495 [Phycisphaerae bacterium]|nr:hypothetical protein [Phycisphaerae bacterium]
MKIVPPVDLAPAAQGARAIANPAALTVEQLARAMGMPVEAVRRHVEDGAPTGADGRVNLIHYAAWLNKRLGELAKNDGD